MLAPWLATLDPGSALLFFLVLNVAIVAGSAGMWTIARSLLSTRTLFDAPKSLTRVDLRLATECTLLNALFSVSGWQLWRWGWLTLAPTNAWRVTLEFLGLLLVMDLGMYVTHRIAHLPGIFERIHRPHHEHVETNALSLFVLSPGEVIGFGSLMLLAILIVRPSEAALIAYLAVNVLVGTIGHLGLRLSPADRWARLRNWDSSQFHARHHSNRGCNFGFYTPLWDWLGGTLAPEADPTAERTATDER